TLMERTQDIARTWTVGKDPGCDVRVDDEYASSRHCQVALTEAGAYVVRDLGSTNGTRIRRMAVVNALGVQRRVDIKVYDWTLIQPGDILVVGRSEIPWRPSGGA